MEKKLEKNNEAEKEITLQDVVGAINSVKVDLKKEISEVKVDLKKEISSVKVDLEKKIEDSIEELATMVQNNFLSMEEKIGDLDKKVDSTKMELKSDIAGARVDLNKRVDIFTHRELEYRVEKVEEKVGVGK